MTERTRFYDQRENLSDPADDAIAITPDDDTDVSVDVKYLFVGTGGDLVVKTSSDTTRTFKNIPDGSIVPFRPTRVLEASTAADILGLT